MNDSDTPIGANGRKEMKVTESNEDLLQKYFDRIKEEGYGKIHLNCLTFDVPPEKIQGSLRDDSAQSFEEIINDPDPARKTFDPLQINAGVNVKIGKAPKEKVAKKVEKLKRDKLEKQDSVKKKNPTGGNEKPDKSER